VRASFFRVRQRGQNLARMSRPWPAVMQGRIMTIAPLLV
jgi:hypothetical protein